LPKTDRFTLLFAGTIAERYQIHDVIRAVQLAQRDVPNILFRIVGKLDKEGDYTERLQNLIRELKVENYVEFHPPVPLDDMPKLLSQSHLGLEPSRHDPYTDYVLPLKLLECVAAGVPCLVSRRPTIENYFGDDQVAYFEPGDIEGMAAKIRELALSPEKLSQLAINARRVFEKYNWSNEKATYFGVISS
jgi:glycosyltransferase involved in cell wall biosynthesis